MAPRTIKRELYNRFAISHVVQDMKLAKLVFIRALFVKHWAIAENNKNSRVILRPRD